MGKRENERSKFGQPSTLLVLHSHTPTLLARRGKAMTRISHAISFVQALSFSWSNFAGSALFFLGEMISRDRGPFFAKDAVGIAVVSATHIDESYFPLLSIHPNRFVLPKAQTFDFWFPFPFANVIFAFPIIFERVFPDVRLVTGKGGWIIDFVDPIRAGKRITLIQDIEHEGKHNVNKLLTRPSGQRCVLMHWRAGKWCLI